MFVKFLTSVSMATHAGTDADGNARFVGCTSYGPKVIAEISKESALPLIEAGYAREATKAEAEAVESDRAERVEVNIRNHAKFAAARDVEQKASADKIANRLAEAKARRQARIKSHNDRMAKGSGDRATETDLVPVGAEESHDGEGGIEAPTKSQRKRRGRKAS
jgi:hypothetical protein